VDEPGRQLWLLDQLDYVLLEHSDAEVAELFVTRYRHGSFGKGGKRGYEGGRFHRLLAAPHERGLCGRPRRRAEL